MNEERTHFYVTTPIYYVNAPPHLGSLYSTLLADVLARYQKMCGKEVFMLTGTDEHGQKIATAAATAGMAPQQFVDGMIEGFKNVWHEYDIRFSYFIRTTDQHHIKGVQYWIEYLLKKGDIYKSFYTGWYCISCETFVTEKDQAVGQVPACSSCGRTTQQLSEECYFFKLSAYQERLLAFYKENPKFIAPPERLQEVISFVKGGLKDLSISRSTISWGIPFPGDEKQVTYVWADALNNYLTAIGYPDRMHEMNTWWPANVQILGKDIVRFHAVYWPAFLMAIDLSLPQRLLVHGWIKIGDQKMSKSLGNAIDPLVLKNTYGADEVRYYLTRYMAITQDSPFSITDLEQRISTDLANDLGNLLNRLTMLALKYSCTRVTPPSVWQAPEIDVRDELWSMIEDVKRELDDYYLHRAYGHVHTFIQKVNAYFHAQEPWKVAPADPKRFAEIISATAHSLQAIAYMLWPVMPHKMTELLAALGVACTIEANVVERLLNDPWTSVFTLHQREPLFKKYERTPMQEVHVPEKTEQTKPLCTIDDFAKLDLVVGTIIKVEEVANSQKLYYLDVDFGPLGIRHICSGVKQGITKEALLGKQGIFVLNFPPRKMAGLESQGMMLSVHGEHTTIEILTPTNVVPNGSKAG